MLLEDFERLIITQQIYYYHILVITLSTIGTSKLAFPHWLGLSPIELCRYNRASIMQPIFWVYLYFDILFFWSLPHNCVLIMSSSGCSGLVVEYQIRK